MRLLAVAALLASLSPAWAQDFTTLKGHGGPIMGIATTPDGHVATASFDNSVGLWEGRTPRWLEGHDAAVNTVTFGEGVLVSGGDDFAVRLWGDTLRATQLQLLNKRLREQQAEAQAAMAASREATQKRTRGKRKAMRERRRGS